MYLRSRKHLRLRAPMDCEKGLPYTQVVGEEVKENCFPPQPRPPGGLRVSSTLIHSKVMRSPSLTQLIARVSRLPNVVGGGVKYTVEKVNWDHVIVGAGVSGLTALERKGGVLIANNLETDTLLDPLDDTKEKVKRTLKEMGEKIIHGDFLGKYEEGYVFRVQDKLLVAPQVKITFAVGGRYLPPIFDGNDLPGVISRNMYLKFRSAYRKVLVLGSCDDAVRTAVVSGSKFILTPRGTKLTSPRGEELAQSHGVEVRETGWLKVKFRRGKLHAEWEDGEDEVDAVVFAPVKQPRLEGVANVGCKYRFVPGMGAYVPEHDRYGLMECGHVVVGGARGLDDPYLSEVSVYEDVVGRVKGPLKYYYEGGGRADPYNYAGDSGKGYACLCEDVLWEDVEKFREFGTVEMLKRTAGVCLGECQGKLCSFTVGSMTGSPSLITFRSPLYPV